MSDTNFDLNQWLKRLDKGEGGEPLLDLAHHLKLSRPKAPRLSSSFKQTLLTNLLRQEVAAPPAKRRYTLVFSTVMYGLVWLFGFVYLASSLKATAHPLTGTAALPPAAVKINSFPGGVGVQPVYGSPTRPVVISAPELNLQPVLVTEFLTCTNTADYWRTHPQEWPLNQLSLSGKRYTAAELLAILQTDPAGDVSYLVLQELIPAFLNLENSPAPSSLTQSLLATQLWLNDNPLGSNPTGETQKAGLALVDELRVYNNGKLGVPNCQTEAKHSSSAKIAPPAVSDEEKEDRCPDGLPESHPKGESLAEKYEVTYEEIMGWFCEGFGFGEIDIAYNLSQQSDRPVAEIFEMRASGLGWGQIRRELGLAPGKSNGNGNNGNGNGNGNNGNGNGNKGNGKGPGKNK
jgi:hypothetical protein